MAEKQPILILPENYQRIMGKDAQRLNIMAARLVADTVKSTLGPKGRDKMLVDTLGDVTITNDGVTILNEMELDHPAAKMMVEIAKTQEDEVGDGTTTAVVLAGKLLENAEKLLDEKIHPSVIARGYRKAAEEAYRILDQISIEIDLNQKDLLKQIAMTAMTGKGAEASKEKLAELIVEAVAGVAVKQANKWKVDTTNIKLEKKKGRSVGETELIKGIVIDKERVHPDMPEQVKDAKIALLDCAIEIKSPETDTKININNPDQLQAFLEQEEKILRDMVEKIKQSGANVVLCQKGIDDIAQYYLAKAGIFAARRIKREDMEKLAKATGARIISNINELSSNVLGKAAEVKEIKEGEESLIYVTGCENPKALTLLIRGGTEHVIDEVERAIKDGIGDIAAALEEGKVVCGGGACEIELARKLREYATQQKGREQLAINAFADAIESIPRILAENAGLDPIDIITELTVRHENNELSAGLNLEAEEEVIQDTLKAGIIEPTKIKEQAIKSAVEVAEMILRIDDVIAAGKSESSSTGQGMPPSEY